MNRHILCVLVTAAAGAATAFAHHSLAGIYDSSKQVTVEGVIAEFHFINPHPYLVVDVKSGTAAGHWRMEMDNRFELAEIGIKNDTFKRGDNVRVSGSAARSQELGLYVLRLDRASDGFRYEQIGSTPRVSRTK